VINIRACLLTVLLSATTSSAHALDRLHFKGMSENDLDSILTAFQQVNVHYLVAADGGSIMTRLSKPNPKVNEVTNFGVLMYFNLQDAESARLAYEKSNAGKAQVRSAPANKIIRAQFGRRNSAPSQGAHEPDFIIFLSAAPKLDVIEYLLSPNRTPISVKAKDGKDVVLAFLDRNKAMQFQSGLQAKGAKTDRVGLDERAFMEFIVTQSKQGRYVLVQGF
jgi:hypothetical protein